jgi:hypothetical protein
LSKFVTTVFRKPTTPTAGAATWTGDVVGVLTTVAVSALLAVVAVKVLALGAAVDSVVVADETLFVIDETLVVGDAGSVVALSVADCVEFDLSLADVTVDGGGLGSVGSAVSPEPTSSLGFGCVSTALGGVAVPDSAVLVCAPPLLLTVTPDDTSSVADVTPDAFGVPALVVEPVLGDVESAPVVVVSCDDVEASAVDAAELADASVDVPVASAEATPKP